MSRLSRLHKVSSAAAGVVCGLATYAALNSQRDSSGSVFGRVFTSWTTNTIVRPEAQWDNNWDHREPSSLVIPLRHARNASNSLPLPDEENRHNEKLEAARPKAVRHLVLVRHGQYNMAGQSDAQRYLTEVGRQQAEFTGQRLDSMEIGWDRIVKSTMTRAQETGKIIAQKLKTQPPVENCSLIEEGAPIAPEPPIGHWRPEPSQFFQDGARIEAGFRKHFHRASPEQEKDSYTLIVCHANVIRYFVCRALQLPPEAWLRISLNHASVTWISIHPSGRVTLRTLGDSGHIPPKFITSH